jgi:hypothetical protein
MGVMRDMREQHRAGGCPALYTDCIIETENEHGEQYGKERLIECFHDAIRTLRGNAVIEAIEADVRSFNYKEVLDDDFTVMLLEFWEEASSTEVQAERDEAGGGLSNSEGVLFFPQVWIKVSLRKGMLSIRRFYPDP